MDERNIIDQEQEIEKHLERGFEPLVAFAKQVEASINSLEKRLDAVAVENAELRERLMDCERALSIDPEKDYSQPDEDDAK